MNIYRAKLEHLATVKALLQEYYASIAVEKRDSPAELQQYIVAPGAGLWIAVVDGSPAGCVALRRLPALDRAAECKRLYVRPQHRGLGLASALLDTLEQHAVREGYQWLYLDSKADLQAALRLYSRRGYQPCERYNDNPQATLFFRKRLP